MLCVGYFYIFFDYDLFFFSYDGSYFVFLLEISVEDKIKRGKFLRRNRYFYYCNWAYALLVCIVFILYFGVMNNRVKVVVVIRNSEEFIFKMIL